MTVKVGWTGRAYEDIEVGDIYPHRLGRTITDTDNIWFTLLTCNPNPIHFDANYAAKTEWGRPLVDSTFTLALVTGLSVSDGLYERREPGLGRRPIASPRLCRRYNLCTQRGAGEARIAFAAADGHRHGSHRGLQPGQQNGDRVQAHDHGL
jgi:hypothetical protein